MMSDGASYCSLSGQTAICVGNHSHALATADRFHISSLLLEDAQRRRAARHNLDLPSHTAHPARALPDGPIHPPQAFRTYLDVLQRPRGNDKAVKMESS